MPQKKDDRRTAYSKKMIRESLYSLMKEKPLNKITVTEICRMADVNRSTFYAYYTDIYDLHQQIIKEYYEKQKIITSYTKHILMSKPDMRELTVDDYYDFTYFYLQTVKENKDLYKFIFNQNSSSAIHINFGKVYYKILKEVLQKNATEKELNAFAHSFTFVNGGTTGIIISWIHQNCTEPVESLARYVSYYYYGIFNAYKDLHKIEKEK